MKLVLTIAVAILINLASTCNASPSVFVYINLSSQTMTVESVEPAAFYEWKVSTGRRGYRTPAGTFKPQLLSRMHYSSRYESAPMPYSIFFSGNYAIHGTYEVKNLGRPVSHGCVRLAPENAKILFNMVKQVGKENVRIQIAR